MFGEKADYYQSIHAIRILSEAMWCLYWEAFETLISYRDTMQWKDTIDTVLKMLLENNTAVTGQLDRIQSSSSQLTALPDLMLEYQKSLHDCQTAIFWLNFLEMSDILHRALPFIHSLSGRDTTSYPYFIGKKIRLNRSKATDIPALEAFGDPDEGQPCITPEVISQARALLIAVFTNKNDDFMGAELGKVRVYTFLNNKSTLLKLLPPTEDAFIQHLRRAALATVLDKTAHISKPNIQPCQDYGWTMDDGNFVPVPSTQPAWLQQMTKTISCGCIKGCN